MSIKILEKKEEPLLARTFVSGEMEFKGATPSKADVAKQLASQLKGDPSLTLISKLTTSFGKQHAYLSAYLYTNKEVYKRVERIKEEEKKAEEKKEEPKAEEKKAESTESKPAEDSAKKESKETPSKKEEPKAEEKPKEESAEKPK